MTTLIKNGLIYDGTGSDPIQKNIFIKNGHIAKIDSVFSHKAEHLIDATGAIVMPGIIDVGSYADKSFSLFWDPLQENVIRQGITTQIVGNDGTSIAPFSRSSLEFMIPHTTRASIVHNWHDVKGFLKSIHGRVTTNIGTLVGMRTIKSLVTNDESKELNKKELEKLKHITRVALSEGAFGISIGYSHTTHANTPYYEINDFAPLAEKTKRVCAIHPPVNDISSAFEEILKFSPKSGINMEISHLRTFLDRSCTQKKICSFIEELSEKNYVHFDITPHNYSSIHAHELLPTWVFGNTDNEILKRLTDDKNKARLMRTFSSFEKLKFLVDGVADPAFQFFEGKTVSAIAENAGLSFGETLLHLLKVTKLRIYFLVVPPDKKMVHMLASHPRVIYSWGRIRNAKKQTPLSLLGERNGEDLIKLENIIERMTSLPAKKYGITKRGILTQGNYADIIVVKDFKPTHVLVNGINVFENNVSKKVFPGMALIPQK